MANIIAFRTSFKVASNVPPIHYGFHRLEIPNVFWSPQKNLEDQYECGALPDTMYLHKNIGSDFWQNVDRIHRVNQKNKFSKRSRRRSKDYRNYLRQASYRGKDKHKLWLKHKAELWLDYFKTHPIDGDTTVFKDSPHFGAWPFRPLLHIKFSGDIQCHPDNELWSGDPACLTISSGNVTEVGYDIQLRLDTKKTTDVFAEIDSCYALPDLSDGKRTFILRANPYLQTETVFGRKVIRRWKLQQVTVYAIDNVNYSYPTGLSCYASSSDEFHDGSPTVTDVIARAQYILRTSPSVRRTSLGRSVEKQLGLPSSFSAKYWRDNLIARLKYNEVNLYRASGSHVQALAPMPLADAMGNVFVDATAKIPVMSQNNLKTIWLCRDCLNLLLTARSGDIDVFEDALEKASLIVGRSKKKLLSQFFGTNWEQFRQLWFQGRYVWSTNWSNYDSFYRYMLDHALASQRNLPHKVYSSHVFDEDARITVGVTYREKVLEGMLKIYDQSYKMGILPTSYVLWDLVPFSFVFDWFVPIGNTLSAYTRYIHYDPLYIDYPHGYEYSIKYSYEFKGITANVYFRFKQRDYPLFDQGSYIISWDSGHVSDQTIGNRTADAIFLATQVI